MGDSEPSSRGVTIKYDYGNQEYTSQGGICEVKQNTNTCITTDD